MPTQTSPVGALTLPVPAAGDATTQLDDPALAAVLDFLGWSLRNDLNTRLAELTGTSSVAVSTSPDFRFDYSPFEVRGPHARIKTPALYLWWDGNSSTWRPSQLQWGRQRDLSLLYIFDELPATAEMVRRAGLFAAIDASLLKASQRGGHPSYSYNSKPTGTRLEDSIGEFCSWEWEYIGGKGVKRIQLDAPEGRPRGPRKSGRTRPGFAGLVRVREIVFPEQPQAADVMADSPITIYHDGVEVMDRTLEPDDGDDAQP